ncbi:MAG: hypothetical protein IBJ15_04265 [Alphaproteobacteria bacterium]|nr:hypothetical protein [Alphaproteobacteria bacterium]
MGVQTAISSAIKAASRTEIREAFTADELGWILGEAAILTRSAPAVADAHLRSAGLALLARHPDLAAPAIAGLGAPVKIAGSEYRAQWTTRVTAQAGEIVALVAFSGANVVLERQAGFAANAALETGAVLVLQAGEAVSPLPGGFAGPVFAVRFPRAQAGEAPVVPIGEHALWPSAWAVAG